MPKVTIDGRTIEVPQGTKVIEAAERLGIIIPRFCYHPSLGAIGACRVCAVKFLEGPVKGVEMSCVTEAQEGMVVSTDDPEAVDFRKHVIEWFMMNHPLDCPVCDEGGHCLLQDMTVAGGHSIRRYPGKKRTYRDQYLGVFVQHEMNRCIHCWRCRRFYQDFAGYRDLGAMQIASHTYFGRFTDGSLESPFSGNLIDVCPTGVYTDKPSRFTGRRWDFERSPSICIHCSLGCNIVASARYREMVRLEARYNESVNGYFICDRGRYGFYYTKHPDRPRRAKIDTEVVPWERAIHKAAERLSQISRRSGPQSIACFGSTRSSLENQAMLKRLSHSQQWVGPRYFEDASTERKVRKAISRLDSRLTVSMRGIEKADFVLAVGADPVNEAPMLALAMRQAHRKGATVVVADPRPVFLPFDFEHLAVAPWDLDLCLNVLIKGAVDRSAAEKMGREALSFYEGLPSDYKDDSALRERLTRLSEKLRQSCFPVVIGGTGIVQETTIEAAANGALLLQSLRDRAGLFYILSGANAFGAALLSPETGSFSDIVGAIESGTVKGLLLMESDPFWFFPDQERLKKALSRLELLVVLDYLPSEAARTAHIFLPTQTIFETDSSFVNQEGRFQYAPPAHCGGIPIAQISAGGHPPREFNRSIPGGDQRAAWRILADLGNAMQLPGKANEFAMTRDDLLAWIVREHPAFAPLQTLRETWEGVKVNLSSGSASGKEKRFSTSKPGWQRPGHQDREQLELLTVDWTFGTEELSSYSKFIQQAERAPCLFIHPKDALRINLEDKEKFTLYLEGGPIDMEVCIVENMACGAIVLPMHRQLSWQKMRTFPPKIRAGQIKKQSSQA
jgi:NADH-quinone oxidoreductase subunit G